jgi:hypothetical protein
MSKPVFGTKRSPGQPLVQQHPKREGLQPGVPRIRNDEAENLIINMPHPRAKGPPASDAIKKHRAGSIRGCRYRWHGNRWVQTAVRCRCLGLSTVTNCKSTGPCRSST